MIHCIRYINNIFVILIGLFLPFIGISQSCLPEGITFYVQSQIDNFQVNYPNCTEIQGNVKVYDYYGDSINNLNGLSVLTYIGGNLDIEMNPSLTSLTGLQGLISIGGNLTISNNSYLTDLSGFDNLTFIGGDVWINYNYSFLNLSGLENLSSIGGDIWINNNYSLLSLSGLENLSSIGGNVRIDENYNLISLSGMENITTIWGNLSISFNYSLTDLAGLENITSINDLLIIQNNNNLTSLSGLDNLDIFSITGLYISGNTSLSNCNEQIICDYLSNPTGPVNIYNNAEGCENPVQVADTCNITLNCLPFGNYYFLTQSDIDNFQTDYPDCTELGGNVYINEGNITDLNGLNVVTSIAGSVSITDNSLLSDLSGLENLTFLGRHLILYDNIALTNIASLINVTSIGGFISIQDNNALTSLSGLDNIDAGTITTLYIRNNAALSICDVQSICDYLDIPNSIYYIEYNAPGCNTDTEIELACAVGLDENSKDKFQFFIYPNPSSSIITIEMPSMNSFSQLSIFDLSGMRLLTQPLSEKITVIDIDDFAKGIYFIKLTSDNKVQMCKFVKN